MEEITGTEKLVRSYPKHVQPHLEKYIVISKRLKRYRAKQLIKKFAKENKVSSKYPPTVSRLLQNFDGWLVGSAADPSNDNPRDFDILIPFHEWHKACLVIPKEAKPNSFGGWKFEADDVEIDIWPGDLSYLFQRPKTKMAYHLGSDTLIKKINKNNEG